MTYEIKDNPVHGKMLAVNGKIIITDYNTAMGLAESFNAQQLVKAHSNRYMIQLPDTVNSIDECDCQAGQLQPATYNQYPDHEVQMARQELYRTAKLAIQAHELLKHVGERQGLEGWVQSKLTRAADYIETVFDYLDYEMRYPSEMYNEADLNPGGSAQAVPGQTAAGQQGLKPGQAPIPPVDGKTQTPGMVKMAKVDMNGKVQGTPIMVPQNSIKSKQQAGFRVVGESATGGASSAGGVASGMGFGNGFLNGGPGAISRRPKKKKKYESAQPLRFDEDKVEVNFTADDIKRMERMRDIVQMKQYAKHLIATPSEKPIKPQKVAWFNRVIDSKKDTMQLIKFMYDMLLGGEGKAVLGTRYSMEPNSYRKVFNDVTTEAWDMLDPSKPYALSNPRILKVGDDPQGIADFAVQGNNVLSIYPFNANQWGNIQRDARNHGYMLRYVGTNPEKTKIAHSGDAPRTGYNMRGEKIKGHGEGL